MSKFDFFRGDSDGSWFSFSVSNSELEESITFLALRDLDFRDEDTVVSARLDVDETLHVFDRSLVDLGVPEGDAHIVPLWLSVCENNRVVEEAPHVFRLDVREEDVRIYS